MAVVVKEGEQGKVVLGVSGRFDFSCHREFMEAIKSYPKGEKGFVVDLADTEYLDSSAMGMLLQLREHSDRNQPVSLVNSNDEVREILRIANFDKLFALE